MVIIAEPYRGPGTYLKPLESRIECYTYLTERNLTCVKLHVKEIRTSRWGYLKIFYICYKFFALTFFLFLTNTEFSTSFLYCILDFKRTLRRTLSPLRAMSNARYRNNCPSI